MTGATGATGLRVAIERSGYYPDVVADTLDTALAGEPVTAWLVQHEATFDRDELRRHVTVLTLTPTRLVVTHVDDHPADVEAGQTHPHATASTESVPLDRLHSVVVSRVLAEPARHVTGSLPREVVLTLGWGAVQRLDLEPAGCGDPDCEADHGYTGTATADDFSVRLSIDGDGEDGVRQALAFARSVSAATTSVATRATD